MRRIAAFTLAVMLLMVSVPIVLAESAVTVLRSDSRTLGATVSFASQTVNHPDAGRVEERILTLPPGHGITPVVVSGDTLYQNPLTLSDAAARLTAQGREVIAGLNASFFDTSYYTPIGLLVENGVLKNLDGTVSALGFLSDGSAIIGKPGLKITLTAKNKSFAAEKLNQVRDSDGLYLYTSDFSANTQTYREGRHVVLTIPEGARLRVGQTLSCTVKAVMNGKDAYKIGKNELVLSATAEEPISRTDGLAAGDSVTVQVTASDAAWNNVAQAVGGLHLLAEKGKVCSGLGNSYAPRTAVGLKPDGSVVFLAIDGRQKGYSAGLTLPQMGQRMLDLGCETVLELDGGGSTTIGVTYPGKKAFEVVNQPSDGKERRCRDYVLLVNDKPATGVPAKLHLYGDTRVLAGSEGSYTVLATDSGGHAVPPPKDVLLLTGEGSASPQGSLKAQFTTPGQGTVLAYDAVTGSDGSLSVTVESALDSLTLVNADGSAAPSELVLASGKTLSLALTGTRNGFSVTVNSLAPQWNVTGGVGSVSFGQFTGATKSLALGTLTVSAGGLSLSRSVRVGSGAILLADFEEGFSYPAGTAGLQADAAPDRIRAPRGSGSAMIRYGFTGDTATATLPLSLTLEGRPSYLHLWLKGDGSGNTAYVRVQDSTGQVKDVSLGTLKDEQFRQLSVMLPANAVRLTDVIVRRTSGEEAEGVFYVDHWVQNWSAEADKSAPVLTELSQEINGDGTIYRIQVTDNAGPPPAALVSVSLDGEPTLYSYNEATGAVQFTATDTKGLSVYTVTAKDSFGAYARWQVKRSGTPPLASQAGGAADLDGSWATETMRYLESRGLLVCVVRDGKLLYEPKRSVTRLEAFEMILRVTGVNTADYAATELPFVDIAGLSETQLAVAKAAYAKGYISGRTSAEGLLLAAGGELTRAELCTLLVQSSVQGLGTGALTFTDAADIPAYARDAVTRLAANGLIQGAGNNRFNPNDPIDRAQTAQLLVNFFM